MKEVLCYRCQSPNLKPDQDVMTGVWLICMACGHRFKPKMAEWMKLVAFKKHNNKIFCVCGHEMWQHSPLDEHKCWECDCKNFRKVKDER
jgi:hypothetical protein